MIQLVFDGVDSFSIALVKHCGVTPAYRKDRQSDEDRPEDNGVSKKIDKVFSAAEHLASEVDGPMPRPRRHFALFCLETRISLQHHQVGLDEPE